MCGGGRAARTRRGLIMVGSGTPSAGTGGRHVRGVIAFIGIAVFCAATVVADGGPGGGSPKKIICHPNCNIGGIATTVTCQAGRAACCCPAGSPPTYTCACSNGAGECTASNCELTY